MSLEYSFEGKRVLITGGASGVGKQLVTRFYEGGASVYTVDKNEENLQKLKAEFPKVTTALVDLANWHDTRNVVQSFGRMDHLVNNAGFVKFTPILEVTEESMLSKYQVFTTAALNVTQVVAKSMINSGIGGSVVNISSIAAHKVFPGAAAYAIAKAGMETLTKSLAVELGPQGVRVNCVAPGYVETSIIKTPTGEIDPVHLQLLQERAVIKRLMDPNEVADLVLFLLSPLSCMIVGQTIVCDGGYTLS